MRYFILCVLLLLARPSFGDPGFWRFEWPHTNFDVTSIEHWSEIRSGGPGKDGIPSISNPGFISSTIETELDAAEGVIAVVIGVEQARAYPLRYLMWHEIVNDTIMDRQIAVTYCPLCNSALVFDRNISGTVYDFGVTGKLRNSDMVMYDRQTETWWQQATGTAIVGELTGTQLTQLPSQLLSWGQFQKMFPNGRVMKQPDFPRRYGQNPYVGYDQSQRPFLYTGENPPHEIPPLERVVRVGNQAWPLTQLKLHQPVFYDDITITWVSGQASALDAQHVSQGRDVGSIRVQDSNGQDVPHDVMFAFAFHAFWPTGVWHLVP